MWYPTQWQRDQETYEPCTQEEKKVRVNFKDGGRSSKRYSPALLSATKGERKVQRGGGYSTGKSYRASLKKFSRGLEEGGPRWSLMESTAGGTANQAPYEIGGKNIPAPSGNVGTLTSRILKFPK